MSINPELIDLLVCPETNLGLRFAEREALADLRSRFAAGQLKNPSGRPITEPFEDLLVRTDQKRMYPVRHGILQLLSDCAVEL